MKQVDNTKLLGKYKTPRFKYGQKVVCEIRGELTIVGLTDGKIPWPIGKREGERPKSIVVYQDLAKAIRKESAVAICHWFGVSPHTSWRWRKALGVEHYNEGTTTLQKEYAKTESFQDWREKGLEKSRDSRKDRVRRKKISAAKIGKKRPKEVMVKAHAANRGREVSAATRRKQSRAHKKLGARPPWLNPAWTPEEDAWLKTELSNAEVAEKIGRTAQAVKDRRERLTLTRKARKGR